MLKAVVRHLVTCKCDRIKPRKKETNKTSQQQAKKQLQKIPNMIIFVHIFLTPQIFSYMFNIAYRLQHALTLFVYLKHKADNLSYSLQ